MLSMKVCITLLLFVLACTKYTYTPHASSLIMETFLTKSTKEAFKAFHFVFNKSREYQINTEEGLKRYRIFKENVKKVKEHNAQNMSWELGINEFSDLTIEEFSAKHLMSKTEIKEMKKNIKIFNLDDYNEDSEESTGSVTVYTEVDHRPYFTFAKNQAQCGSCWSFAAAGALEGNYAKAFGQDPVALSTQQQIDCNNGNYGCNGGSGRVSMWYLEGTGLIPDSEYPYNAFKGNCNQSLIDNNRNLYKAERFTELNNPSIDKWYNELVNGPLWITVDGTPLYNYSKGIVRFSKSSVPCRSPNHAVIGAGVGYDNGSLYIIVRNSWGPAWGENGYFRVYYEGDAFLTCYLTLFAFRPVPRKIVN